MRGTAHLEVFGYCWPFVLIGSRFADQLATRIGFVSGISGTSLLNLTDSFNMKQRWQQLH